MAGAHDGRDERGRALGTFLRARRERTSPTDVGLPTSSRRRTPGLRREELAALAGISTTWYTFLEQGRDVRPSRQVVSALAGALRLDAPERAYLLSLVDGDVDARPVAESLAPEVAEVPRLLQPHPAYVTGSTYDLLAWNEAAAALFPGAVETASPNLARWVFLDPVARDVLVDWADVAQSLLARLRANAGRHPGEATFRRLERDLRAGSVEADAWWPRFDIRAAEPGTKRVRTSTGEMVLTYASFHVAGSSEQTLTVYRTVT